MDINEKYNTLKQENNEINEKYSTILQKNEDSFA